jgi:hypothetical protein
MVSRIGCPSVVPTTAKVKTLSPSGTIVVLEDDSTPIILQVEVNQ